MLVEFKDSRIKAEFDGLPLVDTDTRIDPRLRGVLLELGDWCVDEGIPVPFVTCILRSAKENTGTPGSNPQSAHLSGRAADLRTMHGRYLHEQVEKIVGHLKNTWGTVFLHVLYHDSGGGAHIHLNINYGQ